MTTLVLLSPTEKRRFDAAPKLTKANRPIYFSLNSHTRRVLGSLTSDINKVGYMLQLGYFKASARFYTVKQFKKNDINHVKNLLGITVPLDIRRYADSTSLVHRTRILKALNWSAFNKNTLPLIKDHIEILTRQQVPPKQVFLSVLDYCWKHDIEIPSYNVLAELITDGLNHFEQTILRTLETSLQDKQRRELDQLFSNAKGQAGFRPPLTLLRRLDQSVRPRDISQNIKTSQVIAKHFYAFKPIIEILGLTDQASEYFAGWVSRARTLQVRQFPNPHKAYLHLLAYFRDQYYRRQDALVDILLKSVRTSLNTANKQLREQHEKQKQIRNNAIKAITQAHITANQLVTHIREVVKLDNATYHEKVTKIESLIDEYDAQHSEADAIKISQYQQQLEALVDDTAYFDILESLSIRLQNRVAGILKFLSFDSDTSDPVIMEAINHFKVTDGQVGHTPPLAFLSEAEIKQVDHDDGFRISLYKYLLFVHTMDRIKSGQLNLKYSYRYRAMQDYLIDLKTWRENKDEILETAGLTKFSDPNAVLTNLKESLDQTYQRVNDRLLSQENPYLSVGVDGVIRARTPKTDYKQDGYIGETLAENGYVHILDILREVNQVSEFVKRFKHYSNKHSKMKIQPETVYAGIMGIGCNIGVRKIANISKGVKEHVLSNTVNWCFDLKNIQSANRQITSIIDKLALANAFKEDPNILHTSSDGRKVGVAVDSLHANYSFKYFGKDKGVTMYTFIDERQSLFHSMVISASDREAAFVIDGLLQNDVPEQLIHSTDTHGYSEVVFAATHLIDVAFAPRLKNIGSQRIYGFSAPGTYKKKGYEILPSRTINKKLIIEHWDNILRFMATIKLKHATASQLFKRLNSYAKDHPLYKALKEFGRILKSHYILTFYDDLEFRQRVEKQLSRIELTNKFSHAVFFDNDQEFQDGTKEEQEISAACKLLIQNAIILWNYLYLSQLLTQLNQEQRNDMLSLIKQGSIISWRHVNLKGEYNFTRPAANEAIFDYARILSMKL